MSNITFPTLSRSSPPTVEWGIRANTQVLVSPLNGSVQTLELPGARWFTSFTWETLAEADAALLQAFLVKLRGQANRAVMYPYHRPTPRGTIAGTVLANGAIAQGATTWTLDGLTAATTVKAGDYLACGGNLVMAVADATASGGGAISVTVEPPTRTAITDNAAATFSYPTANFILQDPEVKWATRSPIFTDVSLAFVEAFT